MSIQEKLVEESRVQSGKASFAAEAAAAYGAEQSCCKAIGIEQDFVGALGI
ncbi:unnamed protein product, partial [marine sediment metagenome]